MTNLNDIAQSAFVLLGGLGNILNLNSENGYVSCFCICTHNDNMETLSEKTGIIFTKFGDKGYFDKIDGYYYAIILISTDHKSVVFLSRGNTEYDDKTNGDFEIFIPENTNIIGIMYPMNYMSQNFKIQTGVLKKTATELRRFAISIEDEKARIVAMN